MMALDQQQIFNENLDIVKRVLTCVRYSNQSIERCPEDLYQEGCIKLWKLILSGEAENKENFENYAFIAVRNRMRDCCRHGRRTEDPVQPYETAIFEDGTRNFDILSVLDSSEDTVESAEDNILLADAIAAINDVKKNCNGVMLKGMDSIIYKIRGLSVTDIAKMYGVEPNHVGAWISRAKQHLHSNEAFLEKLSRLAVEKTGPLSSLYLEVAV